MNLRTRMMLEAGLIICENENRSTEYTIQYLQDFAKVDHDCVMNFLCENRDKEKGDEMTGKDLRGKVNNFNDALTDIRCFLREKKVLNTEITVLIDSIKEDCNELFYLIPLEK